MKLRKLISVMSVFALVATGVVQAQVSDSVDQSESSSPDGIIRIPFEMHRGHIVLEVEVNGKAIRLALDNGVLNEALLLYGGPRVDALDLDFDGEQRFGDEGQPGSFVADIASGFTIRLQGLELGDQSAHVTPAATNMWKMFSGEDGVISGALFSHYVVQIDFIDAFITLIEPNAFVKAGMGQELALVSFENMAYTLACTLMMPDGESVSVNPVLDLGSHLPLLLFLNARTDITVPRGATATQVAIGWAGHKAVVPELKIGKYTLTDVPIAFTDESARISENCEGLLGPELLTRFLVTFDYRNQRVFLKPNSRFDGRF